MASASSIRRRDGSRGRTRSVAFESPSLSEAADRVYMTTFHEGCQPARKLEQFHHREPFTRNRFLQFLAKMLLLPLLFYWAQTPMHFSTSQRRILIAATALATFLAPLAIVSTSHLVLAADPFVRDAAVDPARQTGRDEALANRDLPAGKRGRLLREGTRIPPTVGRVVLIGRRWAFVPASHDAAPEAKSVPHLELPQMVISENLMLQRIAEAIHVDSSDDSWTISGEIAEFFDSNRLIIVTAQRANSN